MTVQRRSVATFSWGADFFFMEETLRPQLGFRDQQLISTSNQHKQRTRMLNILKC